MKHTISTKISCFKTKILFLGLCLSLIFLFNIELTEAKHKIKSKFSKKGDMFSNIYTRVNGVNTIPSNIVGNMYNDPEKDSLIAMTYGNAHVRNKMISPDYFNPYIIQKIPKIKQQAGKGPVESAEEIPSTGVYYNGGTELNKIIIYCDIFQNPTECMKKSACGWCDIKGKGVSDKKTDDIVKSNGNCIQGTASGPLKSCPKGHYHYIEEKLSHSDKLKMNMLKLDETSLQNLESGLNPGAFRKHHK